MSRRMRTSAARSSTASPPSSRPSCAPATAPSPKPPARRRHPRALADETDVVRVGDHDPGLVIEADPAAIIADRNQPAANSAAGLDPPTAQRLLVDAAGLRGEC